MHVNRAKRKNAWETISDYFEDHYEREDRNGKVKYRDWETDRKSTRLNSSHRSLSRMPSSA